MFFDELMDIVYIFKGKDFSEEYQSFFNYE
ncbi:hypothetical protein LSO9J_10036 [Candidatus Liberibacter solanacearum]